MSAVAVGAMPGEKIMPHSPQRMRVPSVSPVVR
jgi:hypothetical protein